MCIRDSVETGEIERLTQGDCAIYGWSKASDCDKFALAVTSPEVIGDIWTVSYTHLDVYKRQVLQRL